MPLLAPNHHAPLVTSLDLLQRLTRSGPQFPLPLNGGPHSSLFTGLLGGRNEAAGGRLGGCHPTGRYFEVSVQGCEFSSLLCDPGEGADPLWALGSLP